MQHLMPTYNLTSNAKPNSKLKTLFETQDLIRNVKRYAKRKTLFQTQNLIPSTKPYSKHNIIPTQNLIQTENCTLNNW